MNVQAAAGEEDTDIARQKRSKMLGLLVADAVRNGDKRPYGDIYRDAVSGVLQDANKAVTVKETAGRSSGDKKNKYGLRVAVDEGAAQFNECINGFKELGGKTGKTKKENNRISVKNPRRAVWNRKGKPVWRDELPIGEEYSEIISAEASSDDGGTYLANELKNCHRHKQ